MDYEKKYKEALERARDVYTYYCDDREQLRKIESIFPELKESEDEKISREITEFILTHRIDEPNDIEDTNTWLAWLEKQGKHKDYYTKKELIAMGFSFTLNGDIVTPDEMMEDMKKYLAWKEKQAPKPQGKTALEATKEEKVDNANKVEPKFKVGDWIVFNEHHNSVYQVEKIQGLRYYLRHYNGGSMSVHIDNQLIRLWTIQDAKNGDIVVDKSDGTIGIFESIGHHPDGGSFNDPSYCFLHCRYDDGFFFADFENGNTMDSDDAIPATKEQCDILFAKMKEAGYEWDGEKKELRKIEEEYDGEDYGIDSLFHAKSILEKTLGKVDGYQSDDGILEHKCAITAVKKLYEQKPMWTEEDEVKINRIVSCLENLNVADNDILLKDVNWLKSIKQRMEEQQ